MIAGWRPRAETGQRADALTFAAALQVMLHSAHRSPGSSEVRPFGELGEMRAEVHQAIGMVAVQLDAGI